MNVTKAINSLLNESVKAANKDAVQKPASKAKKAPKKAENARANSKKTPKKARTTSKKTVPVVTNRMLWLRLLTREGRHDGVFNPGVKRKMYVEVKQQYYSTNKVLLDAATATMLNGQLENVYKRNVINIYFDRSKEELDRLAVVHGQRGFGWFARKPDIAITDVAFKGERNTVMVKNPSDFYEYASWAIKRADYVKNNWR